MALEKNEVSAPWYKRITPQTRVVFLSSLIFGLIAHGMGLFNKLSYHDDIFALFSQGSTITSGRWMLHVMGWLEILIFGDGHFSLPLASGLFSILCVAGAAWLLTDMLKIRNPVYQAALSCLMVGFPVVTAYFGFVFTMPYYMLAMLMMVLAAYLICRDFPWWAKIAAVLLGGASVGTYQAFLPMLLTAILLYDMMVLSESEEKTGRFFLRVLIQILCVAGVMVFYTLASRFFLVKFDLELSDYKGINQVGSVTLAAYLERALAGYREFFFPSRNINFDMYPQHLHYIYLLMLAADLALGLRLIFRTGRKNAGKAALLALLFLLVPLGCNFIYVMCEGVHGLMVYGEVMQFVLFLWLLDRLELRLPRLQRVVSLAAALVLALSCVMYARFDNQCYLKVTFQQQQAITFFTTLVTRIKSVPGYRADQPVAFLNAGEISDPTLYNIDELDFIFLNTYGDTITEYLNSYTWNYFMQRWCGYGPIYYYGPDLSGLPEVQAMPHYPDDGSIRIVRDVVVVKF